MRGQSRSARLGVRLTRLPGESWGDATSVTAHRVDICVVEDDAAQRRLLVAELARDGYQMLEADNGRVVVDLVREHRPRVLVCDLCLPDVSGLEICRRLRSDPSLDGLYIVLITADDDGERKQEALDSGADDFLRKPIDGRELRARIRNGMRFHRLQERLRHAALTDSLTGLWNHAQFRELLEREFNRTRRYGGIVALLMLDLDHFKAINDTYGHEVGNRILRRTADHLRRTVRDTDIVARYGGEEFAIICPETSLAEATRLAERIRRTLPKAARLPGYPRLSPRTSIGVASTEDPRATSVSGLINLGDQALYYAKHNGRNQVARCDCLQDVIWTGTSPSDEVERLRKHVVTLTMRSKELCLQSIWALIQALEARDGYSAWHSRNVMYYTRSLVDAAGWPRSLRVAATNAAMLHDLGKIGIPDELLLKPEALNEREQAILRQVPLITCRILEPLRVFETEIIMIRHLRERYDGTGYPDGLAGKSIPIGSRLIAVAEAFDAITCDRTFREARTMREALEIIDAAAGTQFDPEFCRLLRETALRNEQLWHEHIERARHRIPAHWRGNSIHPALAGIPTPVGRISARRPRPRRRSSGRSNRA